MRAHFEYTAKYGLNVNVRNLTLHADDGSLVHTMFWISSIGLNASLLNATVGLIFSKMLHNKTFFFVAQIELFAQMLKAYSYRSQALNFWDSYASIFI
jgi:hypothetical protein